ITTGISAKDRACTIQVMADPTAMTENPSQPGHVFPLRARPGGVLQRAGHTEAAVDLAKLAGCRPIGVICEIMNDDGNMARLPELKRFAHSSPVFRPVAFRRYAGGMILLGSRGLIPFHNGPRRCGQLHRRGRVRRRGVLGHDALDHNVVRRRVRADR
ncbi:MAG TPA: hypothetical protein EYP14_01220, partial [Planctomycetaceae bacterium]|nr:hypothetical protein [Planctomycetaceae bacterium]